MYMFVTLHSSDDVSETSTRDQHLLAVAPRHRRVPYTVVAAVGQVRDTQYQWRQYRRWTAVGGGERVTAAALI